MPDSRPTKRLYFDDANLCEFEARVIAVSTTQAGQPAVILDATAFYPEGGGQPADFGILAGVPVVDVQESEDRITHILAEPAEIQVGTTVTGNVDWRRRFDHMQQHTGQHTLSGAFWRLMGAETTAWHLGADEVTIDIAHGGLSDEQARAMEAAANDVIWRDVPVTAEFYTPEQLERLALRKGTARGGLVRVVSVGDWDRIGCGGTHVATAGQVGAIGIRRIETRGMQSRITFICGARALADFRSKTSLVNDLVARLKVPMAEIDANVERLQQQLSEARHELEAARIELLEYEARDLLAQAQAQAGSFPVIARRLDQHDASELRTLAQRLAANGGIALLGAVTGEKAQLVFACPKDAPFDMSAILKAAVPLIEGKGGGQKTLAQGGGPGLAMLDEALSRALVAVIG